MLTRPAGRPQLAVAFALLSSAFARATAAGGDAGTFATYSGGRITRDEYALWRQGRPAPAEPERRLAQAQRMALGRRLEAQALAAGLDREPALRARLEQAERERLVAALRAAENAAVQVPEADVEAYLAAHQDERVKPPRARLWNIFKRVPEGATPAERQAVRAQVEALRARLVAGADFAELARRESDSQTRFQGGLLGNVPAGTLGAEVERVAFALQPGELSSVLETSDGFTLLRCEQRFPGRVMPLDEARERIRQGLWTQRTEARWQALVDELAAASPRADLRAALAERARARLGADPASQAALARARTETLARAQLERAAARRLAPPTGADVRAYYEAHRAAFERPAEFDFSVIRLDTTPATLRAASARAEELAARLRAGTTAFEAAARSDSQDASAPSGGRLGWRRAAEAAALGPNVFQTLLDLEPGRTSAPVQEDDRLWIVKLWDRRPARPLSFEEAEPEALRALRAERARALGTVIEAELLGELDVRLAPDP